jgi:hypothetical protein
MKAIKRTHVMLMGKQAIENLLRNEYLEEAGTIEFLTTILRELPSEIVGFTEEGECIFEAKGDE